MSIVAKTKILFSPQSSSSKFSQVMVTNLRSKSWRLLILVGSLEVEMLPRQHQRRHQHASKEHEEGALHVSDHHDVDHGELGFVHQITLVLRRPGSLEIKKSQNYILQRREQFKLNLFPGFRETRPFHFLYFITEWLDPGGILGKCEGEMLKEEMFSRVCIVTLSSLQILLITQLLQCCELINVNKILLLDSLPHWTVHINRGWSHGLGLGVEVLEELLRRLLEVSLNLRVLLVAPVVLQILLQHHGEVVKRRFNLRNSNHGHQSSAVVGDDADDKQPPASDEDLARVSVRKLGSSLLENRPEAVEHTAIHLKQAILIHHVVVFVKVGSPE